MKVQVVIHEAEEGGFWAEVPRLAASPRATPAMSY